MNNPFNVGDKVRIKSYSTNNVVREVGRLGHIDKYGNFHEDNDIAVTYIDDNGSICKDWDFVDNLELVECAKNLFKPGDKVRYKDSSYESIFTVGNLGNHNGNCQEIAVSYVEGGWDYCRTLKLVESYKEEEHLSPEKVPLLIIENKHLNFVKVIRPTNKKMYHAYLDAFRNYKSENEDDYFNVMIHE